MPQRITPSIDFCSIPDIISLLCNNYKKVGICIMLSPKEQYRIITKGVQTLVNEEELMQKLQKSYDNNKPLIIKLGLDPSAPDIHIGHAVVIRKIKQMHYLGHQVGIII